MRKSATQAPTSLATSAGREPRSAAGGPVPAPRLVLPRRYSSTPSARTRNKISSTPAPSSGSPLEPLFDTVIAQGSDTSRFPQLRARKPRRTTCPDNAARRTHPGRVRSTTNSVDSGAKHARAKSRATAVNPLGGRRTDVSARGRRKRCTRRANLKTRMKGPFLPKNARKDPFMPRLTRNEKPPTKKLGASTRRLPADKKFLKASPSERFRSTSTGLSRTHRNQ